jgi:formylglycine-generating enzyme required for sulfatase activity
MTIAWQGGSFFPTKLRLRLLQTGIAVLAHLVADWYADTLPTDAQQGPTGPSSGIASVLRGGSWGFLGRRTRSTICSSALPDLRHGFNGFRVAAELNRKR